MNRIKNIREQSACTQATLAKALGIPCNTLSQYETGARQTPDSVKLQIAEIFNVSIDNIIGRGIFAKESLVLENIDIIIGQLSNLSLSGFSISMDEYLRDLKNLPPFQIMERLSVFIKDIRVQGNQFIIEYTVQ